MEVPRHIRRRLIREGGKTPEGLPLFRISWSTTRLTIVGGEWKQFDNSGNITGSVVEERLVERYPESRDRWLFEMWQVPEYSEREWEQLFTTTINGTKVHSLGPYPRQGDYELVKVIETPQTHQFIPLTDTICEALLATALRNRDLSSRHRARAVREQRERAESFADLQRDAILTNSQSAFNSQPTIAVPDLKEVAEYGTHRTG